MFTARLAVAPVVPESKARATFKLNVAVSPAGLEAQVGTGRQGPIRTSRNRQPWSMHQ
jgi:hypothetical protein